MNPRILLGAGALALCSAWAATVPASSTITAVTVYTDRAIVTRTATLDLGATGGAEVAFEKLPASLIEQSLTVTGRGVAQATILDVSARDTHVEFAPNEHVKRLEEALRDLGRDRRTLDDRRQVLKSQGAALDHIEAGATAAPAKEGAARLSVEESLKLLAFLDEQRTKLAAEQQALDVKTEELEARSDATRKQLATVRGDPRRSYKTVIVRLDATTTGRLELALSYAVPGASWTPNYDARATANEATVQLGYFGRVRQNTGEDWPNVALTLSTAQPSLGGGAPEVGTWVVDVEKPKYAAVGAMSPATTAANSIVLGGNLRLGNAKVESWNASKPARDADAARPREMDALSAQASVETAATSAAFRVVNPATIASDNSPQKIPITTLELTAVPEYFTTPKRVAAAFLTAKVTNTSEFPLLAGSMNVFLDGTFVATSALRAVMPGEKFDLALGADEGISVKHKRVQRFAEDTGLTNRGRRVTYEYLVTIQNNKKTPARVIVADHVPTSRYERIVVKVVSPAEKEQKPSADGALKWTLDLKPGEKREVPLKFSIEHPNDLPVTGLEA